MKFRRYASVLIAFAAFSTAPAHSIDGMSLELGNGDAVSMVRVGVQWDWNKRWFQGADWHLGGYWDAAVGYWDRDGARAGEHDNLFDIGLTPVFRVQPNSLRGPYLEAGIGIHLLSHSSIGDRRMSTAFQFGDHIGVGYRFGARGSYDLGYRFQHLSNASIKRPNPGINFHQIRLQHNF
jgi:hypothetical protein